MSAMRVVRRFEIRVPNAKYVSDAARAVEAAVKAAQGEIAPPNVKPVEHPPLVEVRLEGTAVAVSKVMRSLADSGARIQHDVLKVRRDGRNGLVYPDPDARVRLGVESVGPTTDGEAVTVAIVDSGLMVKHPAFENHLWTGDGGINGKQFIEGKDEDDISDQDGHGTLLAGTVLAAAADAPVKLMVAKFFDSAHPSRPDNAAAALDFAVKNEAKIILLAWDVGIGSPKLEKAFREACKHALVVIAAGNYGSDNDWHEDRSWARAPVRYTKDDAANTITVMATDEADEKASFSNYGRQSVDLAAPGVGITSTRRALSNAPADEPRKYRTHTGTSAAAAHVAGAAALLMSRYPVSRYPHLTVHEIKRCLVDSVDKLPGLKCAGGGRLNIAEALLCAQKKATAPNP
jgi:thermitase